MTVTKSIKEEIAGFELPDNVKSKALQIFELIKDQVGTCRSHIRKQLLYFLVHNAYLELGEPPIQSEIIRTVKVDDSSVSKALKEFTWPRTRYRMKDDNSTPEDLLPHYGRVLGIRKDAVDDLIQRCQVWTHHPTLKRMPVIVVTAGILKYYMDTHGLTIDWPRITHLFNVSKVVIEGAYDVISNLDNN